MKRAHLLEQKLPILFLTLIIACLSGNNIAAQNCGQLEYRLVATTKASTLEKELNELAKQGFRVELEAQAIGMATFTMLLGRPRNASAASNSTPRYEYKTLNLAQFKKQVKDVQAQGYVVRTAMLPSTLAFGAPSPIILLEREIAATAQYEFDFIVAPKEKKLQTMLDNANSSGFTPIGMLGGIILLRRDLNNPAAEMGKREYRLLDTYKISTLQKEMSEAAQEGFRLVASSEFSGVLMSRDYKPQEQRRYEYQLAPIRASESSANQLNNLSRQGFVLRDATQFGLTAIMERESGKNTAAKVTEFKVLETRTEATMQKEIEDACAQDFTPVNLTGGSSRFMMLLARELPKGN